jgi:hypothetical protein
MHADALKNITSLELKPCPTNDFWLHIPNKFLARIKYVSVSMDYASDLPFGHLTNVVRLRWDVESVGSAYVCNLTEHLHWLTKSHRTKCIKKIFRKIRSYKTVW